MYDGRQRKWLLATTCTTFVTVHVTAMKHIVAQACLYTANLAHVLPATTAVTFVALTVAAEFGWLYNMLGQQYMLGR